jgi:hypothetical protein
LFGGDVGAQHLLELGDALAAFFRQKGRSMATNFQRRRASVPGALRGAFDAAGCCVICAISAV